VSVCAAAWICSAQTPHLDGLTRAAALLSQHTGDLPGFFAADARAGHLPAYLESLAGGLRIDLERVQGEAGELLEKTSLLRETIRALQEYARSSRDHLLREPSDLRPLVDMALRIEEATLRRAGVQVRRILLPVPQLLLERGNVVHVLVNLIKNALEAMRATPEGARRLTVELGSEGGGAEVRVRDTGEGISRENLTRIFGYGFTTKPDGHGFGLHACANLMSQMGGTIRAESDGPGRGAVFTLSFPTSRVEAG
jgi:signal transduction histidine kinase